MIQNERLQKQKNQMFPKFVLNDMPKPGPGRDFTSGQILNVPVNPRDILTDIQGLDVMSAAEFGTRDSISALSSLNSECHIQKGSQTLVRLEGRGGGQHG